MNTPRPGAQIGATQSSQTQVQAGTGTTPTQQGSQQSGSGQIQQTGANVAQSPKTRFTDWASI
jgi:hypothetical protein